MTSLRTFLFLLLIPFIFSSLCSNSEFSPVLVEQENYFEIGPNQESCYKYTLLPNKSKLILAFSRTISSTSEVLLYRSNQIYLS